MSIIDFSANLNENQTRTIKHQCNQTRWLKIRVYWCGFGLQIIYHVTDTHTAKQKM